MDSAFRFSRCMAISQECNMWMWAESELHSSWRVRSRWATGGGRFYTRAFCSTYSKMMTTHFTGNHSYCSYLDSHKDTFLVYALQGVGIEVFSKVAEHCNPINMNLREDRGDERVGWWSDVLWTPAAKFRGDDVITHLWEVVLSIPLDPHLHSSSLSLSSFGVPFPVFAVADDHTWPPVIALQSAPHHTSNRVLLYTATALISCSGNTAWMGSRRCRGAWWIRLSSIYFQRKLRKK